MKAKSRLGKAESIFMSTVKKADSIPSTGSIATIPAAEAVGSSIENKMTVIMPPHQIAFLDRLCLDIREKTNAKMKRTEIIRALVAGLMASGLDLTAYGTEEDIADIIGKRLKVGKT